MTTPSLPKSLLDAARQHTLVPFVGAGVSMAVRRTDGQQAFPSWPALLHAAADRLAAEQREIQANDMRLLLSVSTPDYLDIAKRAKAGLGPHWFKFLRQRFTISENEIESSSLALARNMWQLGSKLVITTNYDPVLKLACPSRDIECWKIQSEIGHVELLAGRLTHPTLWQLHGSVEDINQVILTPDGYQQLYADDDVDHKYRAALGTLRYVMAARTLLFVGFSLDDPYIVRQLDWVQETFGGCSEPHYVLTHRAELSRMSQKLEGSAIIPIAFESFGDPLLRRVAEIAAVATPKSTPEQPAQPPAEDPPPPPPAAPGVGQPVHPKRSKRKQTRREFLAACPKPVADFFDELFDDAVRRGHALEWGEKGFTIAVDWQGKHVGLFYGMPPGVRGAEHAELWAYLHEVLPNEVRAWGWKQYEKAAPFRNGGKYTLKLALDHGMLEPARRSVEVLWKVVARLLKPAQEARAWLVWEDHSEGDTRNFVTHLVSASTESPFRAIKTPLQGVFVTSSTSTWELRWPQYRLINQPCVSELWGDPEAPVPSTPFDPEEYFIAGAEFVSDGRVISIGEESPTAIRRHEGLDFLDRKYDVLGSAGPHVFVRHTEACFTVNSFQVNYDAWFSIVDLEERRMLTLVDLLGEPAIAAIASADGPRAQLLFAANPDNWGGGMRPVELVTVAPAYSPAGILELRCQFTQDVCRADTDGHWSEYTRSQYVPSAFVPERLEPYRQLPAPVLAWRSSLTNPAERWGWCPVYDVHAHWCRSVFGTDVFKP